MESPWIPVKPAVDAVGQKRGYRDLCLPHAPKIHDPYIGICTHKTTACPQPRNCSIQTLHCLLGLALGHAEESGALLTLGLGTLVGSQL
jgi:hypothetical protein